TAASTGLGLPGATVTVAGGSSTTTNPSGDYTLSLANGSYSLTASATGYVDSSASVRISGSGATQNFGLSATTGPPGDYPVTGLVVYLYNSTPVAGAAVSIGGGATVRTGLDGTFAFQEPNGTYLLNVSAAGCGSVSRAVTVDGAAVTLTVPLPFFDWNVSGNVVDSVTGQGIAGANVSTLPGPMTASESTQTDSLGQYRLGLPNGTYSVNVSATGYASTVLAATVKGSSITLDAVLQATGAVRRYPLMGTITYATNGSPASGIPIQILPGASATSNGTGQFLVLLANGSYTIGAVAPGWTASPQGVEILGQATPVSLKLYLETYRVSGFVRFSDGTPGPGLDVGVRSLSNSTLTGPDGSYAMALPNGTFVLTVSGSGVEPRNLTVSVQGGPVTLNVVVAAAGTSATTPPAGGFDLSRSLLGMNLLFLLTLIGAIAVAGTSVAVLAVRARRRRLKRM
ncbi:MAG TPA: carboxypeptidase regulatory-like domain-containing protein, partial [Thermoplasmata archaeon]|nr:carboxypeptidase regulatory-like domain-containing protein [Thermoplasmata archaeon]